MGRDGVPVFIKGGPGRLGGTEAQPAGLRSTVSTTPASVSPTCNNAAGILLPSLSSGLWTDVTGRGQEASRRLRFDLCSAL